MTLKTRIIVSDADPVIVWNGVIYYETWSDETLAYDGKLTLSRIMPDGTGRLDLYTTKPDLYTDSFPMGDYACVAQIYFSEDYIYFSYGSTAGSGSFFQGGRVVRVNYDGSGGEVVSRMDKLCGSDFEVAPDGTVTCHYESSDFHMLYSSLEKFRIMDGSVWWYDRTSGNL